MLPDRIRLFNKHVLNPILRVLAILSVGPFAILRHVGRRSGKLYETTIMVWPLRDGFMIALTYGPKVDWYRNVQAAGGCKVYWHRCDYALGAPQPLDAQSALPAFPALFRFFLRRAGLRDYIWMNQIA